MEQAELFSVLKATGLPVVYHHFVSPPKPPYLVYLFTYTSNFGADNKVYNKVNSYQVELYSSKKDLEAEKIVEDALDGAEIYWEKSENYLDPEKLYQVLYEIEI